MRTVKLDVSLVVIDPIGNIFLRLDVPACVPVIDGLDGYWVIKAGRSTCAGSRSYERCTRASSVVLCFRDSWVVSLLFLG